MVVDGTSVDAVSRDGGAKQLLARPFVENSRRVLGAVRTMQLKDHWLQRRAAECLGFSYRSLLKLDRSLSGKKPVDVLAQAQDKKLTPMKRWGIAYKIRKANTIWAGKLVDKMKAEALVDPDAEVGLSTVCKEEMVADVEVEREWARVPMAKREFKNVLDSFTGDLTVIVEMEDCSDLDVKRMIKWLADTGAARVFDEVDGHWSRWLWTGDRWVEDEYPIIKAKWEK